MPPAVEAWSLNHWTTREVPHYNFVKVAFGGLHYLCFCFSVGELGFFMPEACLKCTETPVRERPWRGLPAWEEERASSHHWWECNLVDDFGETLWHHLSEAGTLLSPGAVVGTHPRPCPVQLQMWQNLQGGSGSSSNIHQ